MASISNGSKPIALQVKRVVFFHFSIFFFTFLSPSLSFSQPVSVVINFHVIENSYSVIQYSKASVSTKRVFRKCCFYVSLKHNLIWFIFFYIFHNFIATTFRHSTQLRLPYIKQNENKNTFNEMFMFMFMLFAF